MCELFGITSAEKVRCNDYLKRFYRDSVNHPDGWGIARFYGNSVSIEKEPIAASQSIYLENRLTDDIEEDILLAHIRRASVGGLFYKNTHPFAKRDRSGRLWTLIHNGTIFESALLDSYKEIQNGSCDSERILLYLVDQIDLALEEKMNRTASAQGKQEECSSFTAEEYPDLTEEERCRIMERVVREITPRNKVNLLVYDGDLLYVHTNHPNSLYGKRDGRAIVICSRPLDDSEWCKVPLNIVFACKKDQVVFGGQVHPNLYLKPHETADGYDSMTSTDIFYI